MQSEPTSLGFFACSRPRTFLRIGAHRPGHFFTGAAGSSQYPDALKMCQSKAASAFRARAAAELPDSLTLTAAMILLAMADPASAGEFARGGRRIPQERTL